MCDIYMSLAEPSCVPSFVHFCAALTESLSKAVPLPSHFCFRSPNSLLLGFYLRKIELATLTGRAPELCGWALCPGSVSGPSPPLVLVLAAPLNSVARLLSSSCPCLGRAPELCGWALWPGSVSGSCPCLGRAPELCGPALVLLLSLSWPRP